MGDGVNRIHWPSTARLGKLMVKEFDLGMSATLWMLLDFRKDSQAGEGIETTDETAATIAASVAARVIKLGMAVGLVIEGDRHYELAPDQTHQHLNKVLETLAKAKAEGRTSLDKAITSIDDRLNRYTTLMVITSALQGDWLATMEPLKRRGVRLCVIHIDAASFGARGSSQEVLAKLRALGVPTFNVRRGQSLAEAFKAPLNGLDHDTVRLGAEEYGR